MSLGVSIFNMSSGERTVEPQQFAYRPVWGGWSSHLPPAQITATPGEYWKHYESHVFWLLQCLQYNSTSTADGEAGMSWHQPSPKCVDNQLPHQQTTVHEASALFPWGSAMQHGGPSGDRLFPFYLLHFWLQIQHHKLPPPEVLRWYIHRWMCIWGDRSWV